MKRLRLLRDLRNIISDECVRKTVLKRIKEFEETGRSREKVFRELCFCILTANYSAEGGLRVQEAIGDGFFKLNRAELSRRLRSLGYRYPKTRARYIVEARRQREDIWRIVNDKDDPIRVRRWLADNVQGIGFKEASHFLRNMGFKNLAIIDKHVLRILKEYGLIRGVPKSLSRSRYLEIENILSRMADEMGIPLAELDLYLWYMDTGKIIK
ncbi:MAG: N-glycosylase/DNA lyase [Thermoproteota archaeon]